MQPAARRTTVIVACVCSALAACAGANNETSQGVRVSISGEELATEGILFPTGSEVRFADGWQLEFSHVLVTVGRVTLAKNPDKSPADQALTDAEVAGASGPWAIDLHEPGDVPGAAGEGSATLLATIPNQNLNGAEPFASDERYAFGYDVVRASAGAARVNLSDEANAAYERMIAAGHSVAYLGTASFAGSDCASSSEDYDFDALPQVVPFELGFATPTSYLNCQNLENQGDPFPDEEFQRGIAIPKNTAATAQITLHLEHPFFSSVVHDSALYFGQLAAQLVGKAEGTVLTMEALAGLDPIALEDAAGTPLPYRVCGDAALPQGRQMSFETGSVPVDPSASPGAALRDYADYVRYLQSTQGHLNGGEGLCFTERRYASPP